MSTTLPAPAHDPHVLSGAGPASPAPSPTLRLAVLLGRLEGRRALAALTVTFVAIAALVVFIVGRQGPSAQDDWVFAVLLDTSTLLAALGALLMFNLTTTRERRDRAGTLLDAAPGTPAARTGGVLVATLVPSALMLLMALAIGPLVALFTAFDVGDPQVTPLRGDGLVGLLILARHSELVLLGGVLGVAMAMWLPRFWVALLVVPPLSQFGLVGMWGAGGNYAWLAPNANQLSLRSQYDYACEVDRLCFQIPQPLGQFTSYGHLIYVAGLCGLIAAMALLRRSRSWRVLLFGGLSLAVSVGMGLALVG